VQLLEACDDGNDDDSDACSSRCALARCGDGILRQDLEPSDPGYERCDDGNADPTDGCSHLCAPARCGDGVIRRDVTPEDSAFEACDDGNRIDGDGCSAACGLEACGNGRVDAGEDCDDGNDRAADGCLNDCRTARCGDGITRRDLDAEEEGFEACDDGNRVGGDGCSASCRREACGNGVMEPGEACDDGNLIITDACTGSCEVARCGDGIRRDDLGEGDDDFEACDDGNEIDGDGCNADCSFARCGDGRRDIHEACDDGNRLNIDGCTNGCEASVCGDGILRLDLEPGAEGYEACDDNNRDGADGCTNDCLLARCGDAIRRLDIINFGAGWEECDDGNAVDGDGCTRRCRFSAIADADGYIWDPISPYQGLNNGTSDAWDGFGYLRINNVTYRGALTSVDWVRRVYYGEEVAMDGFQVLRRFYAATPDNNADLRNFGRFFIRVRNPSEVPRSVSVRFWGNLGSDADTEVTGSSDGDRRVELRDVWIATDDADGAGDPSIAVLYQTPGPPVAVTTITLIRDALDLRWNPINVPAGGQITMILFAAQNPDRRSSHREARAIMRMPAQALRHLSAEDLASLINIRLP
jgi:cysteine-rich repeat protein